MYFLVCEHWSTDKICSGVSGSAACSDPFLNSDLIRTMARSSKATKTLKVVVPRPNAQRIGPGVTSTLQKIAREQGIIIQLPPPVQEQPNSASTLAAAVSVPVHSLRVFHFLFTLMI